MSTEEDQLKFIKETLIDLIGEKLNNESVLKYDLKCATTLNGFMSAMYSLRLDTEEKLTKKKSTHEIFLKFMKGDDDFRKFGRVYTQFANEIFIYNTVMPYYEKVLNEANKSSIKVANWIPTVYIAKYGTIEGLSSASPESVLALENLNVHGFRGGPRLYLDRMHMKLMMKTLAEYHSLTYVLRIRKDAHLENLIGGIIPFPFVEQNRNLYGAIYPPAFDRFFTYFEKIKDSINDANFVDNITKFRKNYGTAPLKLLERFRKIDETFSVIQHGDFNRNNILFKYEKENGFDNPQAVRMIDFQELRYGSPAMDISFCMYMNMDPAVRNDFWMELLKFYHTTLINSIAEILEVDVEHKDLQPYSFEHFYKHFSKFAFYGALVCIHFVPWMACPESECAVASDLFEKDMYGDDFKKIAFEMGGDDANKLVFDVVEHANRQGYMDHIFD